MAVLTLDTGVETIDPGQGLSFGQRGGLAPEAHSRGFFGQSSGEFSKEASDILRGPLPVLLRLGALGGAKTARFGGFFESSANSQAH
jgi:hypothetical protein